MYRQFDVTPTTSFQSLWAMIVAAGYCDSLGNELDSSAVKNDAIVPDRGQEMTLLIGTGAGDITIADKDPSGKSVGYVMSGLNKRTVINQICLKDYYAKSSDGATGLIIEMEYK